MKKIVLISSGQPSLNPRLVKEADALIEAGYQLTIIYQYWNEWGSKHDVELFEKKQWEIYRIGGNPTDGRLRYWFTRFQHKIGQFLYKSFNIFSDHAIGRSTPQLISKAKSIKADLYIAHNLAALPAAVLAAKKNDAKCGFDAEDFHRNEVTDNIFDLDFKLKKYIEDKYIKRLDYLSTASPLVGEAYSEIYPKQEPITILNAFPKQARSGINRVDEHKLKLFWFSQTIGINRGIENIIKALSLINEIVIELHLLGNHSNNIKNYFLEIAKNSGFNNDLIYYYTPISANKIYDFASQFDVGLAAEMTIPKNRDICLTNKIFTYVQSGLAILASNTSAQEKIMDEFPNMGIIYDQFNIEHFANQIRHLAENRDTLKMYQTNSKNYGDRVLNWETEKIKFLTLIAKQLYQT